MRRKWHNPRPVEYRPPAFPDDGEREWRRCCALHLLVCQDPVLEDERGQLRCPVSGHPVREFVVLDAASLDVFASVQTTTGRFWVREDS